MKHVDMRKLPAAAQEERRRQVIGLREAGLTYDAIAAQVGLTRTGVFDICKRFRRAGPGRAEERPARARPRHGTASRCASRRRRSAPDPPAHARRAGPALRAVEPGGGAGADPAALRGAAGGAHHGHLPGALGLHRPEAAAAGLRAGPGGGAALAAAGLPGHRGTGQGERGTIFWGDETGLRSDDVRGRSYAPRGRTPEVRPSHKRAGLGLISAVTNKGELRWMVLDGAVKAPSLIRFLARLVRDASGKVFLILDRLPVHRARPVPRLAGRAHGADRGLLPASPTARS